MSKAFTRESDDIPELAPRPRSPSPLPVGAKNYVTQYGARLWQEELERLLQSERPQAEAAAADDERERRLESIDQRIRQLRQNLHSVEVVPPPPLHDHVRFGATVTVRDSTGSIETYRIVGVDETDVDRGWVSWLSPIAKALLNAPLGGQVRFRFPTGEMELEIVAIAYE